MSSSTRNPTRSSRHRRLRSIPPDPIDVLDNTSPAGVYHHGGPYDATLLSRNLNPKYSPLAAVRDSNMAALEATPREFVADALTKHVPLQGTSSVPPGHRDLGGAVMRYEDGTDMMREEGRDGGAYKRWPGLVSFPELSDLYETEANKQTSRTTRMTSRERESPPTPSKKPKRPAASASSARHPRAPTTRTSSTRSTPRASRPTTPVGPASWGPGSGARATCQGTRGPASCPRGGRG